MAKQYSPEVEMATTILNQLGGKRFVAMTGAKNFVGMPDGLRMDIGRNRSKANRLHISLDAGRDLYDVHFYYHSFSQKTLEVTVKNEQKFEGVEAEQLATLFEKVTGMYLALPRVKGINI